MRTLTEQENFWIGDFGTTYIDRNTLKNVAPRERGLWQKVLSNIPDKPKTLLELGCNIGINLVALSHLLPEARLTGIEINANAAECARRNLGDRGIILRKSLFDSEESGYDFVFTSGVLIHLAPEMLPLAYQKLHDASSRYICLAEYFNTTPISIPYRGHEGKLYKRDFAGEFLDTFPDVRLVDYGFLWRRDPVCPDDDITWFLMEKQGGE